ncbi:MAG: hypothetical protein ACFFD2_27495, partial [Promethearchaeota archaeon]
DSLIYEIYFQRQFETNLCELIGNYITPLQNSVSDEEKFLSLSEIMQKIQKNSAINQTIDKIKKDQIIERIESLFQKRTNLLQIRK